MLLLRPDLDHLHYITTHSVMSFVERRDLPPIIVTNEKLKQYSGVAVHLYPRRSNCIRGRAIQMQPVQELWAAARRTAAKAVQDANEPIIPTELPGMSVRVSIPASLTHITSLEEMELGRHGLYVIHGARTGYIFPGEITQRKWTKNQAWMEACRRAAIRIPVMNTSLIQMFVFSCQHVSGTIR